MIWGWKKSSQDGGALHPSQATGSPCFSGLWARPPATPYPLRRPGNPVGGWPGTWFPCSHPKSPPASPSLEYLTQNSPLPSRKWPAFAVKANYKQHLIILFSFLTHFPALQSLVNPFLLFMSFSLFSPYCWHSEKEGEINRG